MPEGTKPQRDREEQVGLTSGPNNDGSGVADPWDVEWDVDSPRESSDYSGAESPVALFRRTYDDPDGKKEIRTAIFLIVVSVTALVVQTEATVYVQTKLGWDKAYMILYLTHGFYFILWPGLVAFQRYKQPAGSFNRFFEDHLTTVQTTAQYVEHQTLELTSLQSLRSPISYMAQTCFTLACALNFAAVTWFVAAKMTTPTDLTVLNNTSTVFTYIFSVWLLKESMRMKKNIAVGLALIGVVLVAYGNPNEVPTKDGEAAAVIDGSKRVFGNVICAIGAVLFGLYRVLYKLKACLPTEATPEMNITFSVIVGSLIGVFTTAVFWLPLPLLHFTGLETFEWPSGAAAFWVGIGILSSAIFTASFLSLTALTSPVLSSVAAMLSIFVVALFDWLFSGHGLSLATVGGGLLIIIAFGLIGWSTYEETYLENRPERFQQYGLHESRSEDEGEV